LRGQAAYRSHREIDGIDAGAHGGEHGCCPDAAGIVRMKMNRQADFLFERGDEFIDRRRPTHTGHVLDANNMRACLLEFARHANVVGEIVFVRRRRQQITGIANRCFTELARLEHGVECYAHVLDPVQ